jgi:DNA-binding NarL/FixJ family response regulator
VKILIIDDHLLVREGLKGVLKQVDAAAEILEAGNAAEAFRAVEATPNLDLILLDLTLPDDRGFAVLSRFRRSHADIPVVVLSASTDPADVMRSMRGGASGFIPKSCNAGVMLGALRLVLSGGIYLPPDILLAQGALEAIAKPAERTSEATAAAGREPAEVGLSHRQAEVLALLVEGALQQGNQPRA